MRNRWECVFGIWIFWLQLKIFQIKFWLRIGFVIYFSAIIFSCVCWRLQIVFEIGYLFDRIYVVGQFRLQPVFSCLTPLFIVIQECWVNQYLARLKMPLVQRSSPWRSAETENGCILAQGFIQKINLLILGHFPAEVLHQYFGNFRALLQFWNFICWYLDLVSFLKHLWRAILILLSNSCS